MTGRERLIPYAFLLPALALIVIFNLFPTIATLIESLHGKLPGARRAQSSSAWAISPAC